MPRTGPHPDPDSLKAHFATELRRLRSKAGLSQQQLAAALGCTSQWIGQLENGDKTVSAQTAQDLDTYFKTEGSDADDGQFHRLYRSVKKANLSRVLIPGFDTYLEHEQKATTICCYAAQVMPGLLQLEDYAYGTMSPNELPDTHEARVVSRMERRTILDRENPPSTLFVIDESVFQRLVGGAKVMAKQLDHLIGFADSPRVRIHILPIEPVTPASLEGGFILLGFSEENDLMYVEAVGVGQLIENRGVVADCRVRFNTLMGEALSRAESIAWMKCKREECL